MLSLSTSLTHRSRNDNYYCRYVECPCTGRLVGTRWPIKTCWLCLYVIKGGQCTSDDPMPLHAELVHLASAWIDDNGERHTHDNHTNSTCTYR
jgi:hypothetical protein